MNENQKVNKIKQLAEIKKFCEKDIYILITIEIVVIQLLKKISTTCVM